VDNGRIMKGTLTGKVVIAMRPSAGHDAVGWGRRYSKPGGRVVECPVGGSVGTSPGGQVVSRWSGGERLTLALARPILEQLCRV